MATHRLTEIEVHEVSLVDKPANRRKFLIVKSATEGEDMGAALKPDGAGGFTKEPEVTEVDVDKKLEIPKGIKEPLCAALMEGAKKLTEYEKELRGAKEVEPKEGEPPVPFPETIESGIKDACYAIKEALPAPAAPPAPGPADGAPASEAPMEMAGEPAPQAAQMREDTEKLGAKMSKERFSRFQQALSVLGSLLDELKPQVEAQAAAAEPTPQETQMAETIKRLQAVVRSQSEKLEQVEKTRHPGNAVPVEHHDPVEAVDDDIHWPLDLNTEVSRAQVEKEGISFMD